MKITKQQFKQTIKEELSGILEEKEDPDGTEFFFATTKEGMTIVNLQAAYEGDVEDFKEAAEEKYPEHTIVSVTNQIPN